MKLTDAENSAESGIDILASPPGKKLQNILLLSGGEKALTALSLLVGIFQFQPGALLHPRRGRRAARRDQRGPLRQAHPRHERNNAVRCHHSQQTHHGSGRCHLRCDHAGARRFEDRKR